MKVLIISTIWVEPTSSAAGSRMLQLIGLFLEMEWELTYASTAASSEHAFDLEQLGVAIEYIQVNDASFDAFAKAYNPNIVLFDRFMTEEQFGWRIAEQCPDALKLLDTEDLHCLRKARQQAVNEQRPFKDQDLLSDTAKREIAAIYRCDLTLMISCVEIALLKTFFKVPASSIYYVPFLLEKLDKNFNPYEEREHFISIGNFIHAPNWDAVLELKTHIWPLIKVALPLAQLHIYGAYPSEKVLQLNNRKEGFMVKGRAEDATEVIRNARVLLAPLRFGAGLKGKFIEAMCCGTPSVTTAIGAEGMTNNLEWGGTIVGEERNYSGEFYDDFSKAAVSLYLNKNDWEEAQFNGKTIINSNFQKSDIAISLVEKIKQLHKNLKGHRLRNFTGQMLLHHSMRSTKFMSKWIVEKNTKREL